MQLANQIPNVQSLKMNKQKKKIQSNQLFSIIKRVWF